MTLEEFFRAVLTHQHTSPEAAGLGALRRGQFAFNLLLTVNPALAEEIRGGPIDPFQVDARLPDFLARVAREYKLTEDAP